jgi:hypothetical protein
VICAAGRVERRRGFAALADDVQAWAPPSDCREAVGKLPGSGDFLYINDKESILSWVISVSEAPLRPLAALL